MKPNNQRFVIFTALERTHRLNIMNRLILLLGIIAIVSGCKKENENTQNHLPKAAFSISPIRAEANDSVYFDAGIVTDKEDPLENLQVQWSFNGDGNYTPYSPEKTAVKLYAQEGIYFPKMRVIDTYSLTDTAKGMVVIVHDLANLPPERPLQVSPPEWQTWMDPSIIFKWTSGSDPEDDVQSFDLWVGRSVNAMVKIRTGISDFTLVGEEQLYEVTVDGFQFHQDYYWQVAAMDPNGNYTLGHIWKFTTRPE